MPRAKSYLDIDVLTAARQRVRHIFDLFDTVVVCWSGGKDSSACLHLVKEVHDEYGLGPVHAVFRDEEIINHTVTDYVASFRDQEWLDLHWFCLPTAASRVTLGEKVGYVTWDPGRGWMRPMPEWGISAEMIGLPEGTVLNEHTMDDVIAQRFKGKVAFVTGVRAAESLIRFRAVTQKLNENYISSIEHNPKSRVKLCKPIYDWQQQDVLKYLYDENIGWCLLYDAQELAHVGLRVSTPLHAGSVRVFDKLRAVEPDFYSDVIELFPEMLVHERYSKEFDRKLLLDPYLAEGYEGVERYIVENIKSETGRAHARLRASQWKARADNDPDNYPLRLLLETIAFGFTTRRLAGVYVDSKVERAKRNRGARPD